MNAKLKTFLIEAGIVIVIALACIYAVHHISFLKDIFGAETKPETRTEDTPEFKAIQKKFEDEQRKSDKLEGKVEQLEQDKSDLYDELGNVKPVYINNVTRVKKLSKGQNDDLYQRNLSQQNEELQNEIK